MSEPEDRFMVLDHVPVGVCVIDKDYTVLFWNRCLEGWTGIAREYIVGTDLNSNFPCFNEPTYHMRIDGIFNVGPPVIFSAQLHRQLFPSFLLNGEMRVQHTTVTGIPAFDGDGSDFYALFSVEDVTELTRYVANYS